MNLRNRITWEEEKNTITFIVNEESADADVNCGGRELAQFLVNIVNIAGRMLEEADFPDEVEDKILATWKKNIRDFTKKRK